MKHLILFITMCSILSFLSCRSQHQIKDDIYMYGTREFESKAEKLNVSIEQAAMLASDYYFKNIYPDTRNYFLIFHSSDTQEYFFTLHIICGDNYIFTTVLNNPKRIKYNMSGIWVNGMTGEVKHVVTKQWTEVDLSHYPVNTYIKEIKKE